LFNAYPDYLQHSYGWEDMENSSFFPSTVHHNDALTRYNFKYLFQRAMSVFDFQIPDDWEKNFFLNTLYGIGFLLVLNTDEFGTICQFGNISGFDLYYQPARADVVNPVFDTVGAGNKYTNLRIWKDCGLIRLSPSYSGIHDICRYYAEMLSTAQTSLRVNLLNTRYAYIFGAKNKTQAETLKRLYDDLASGNPAVFVDKQLYDEEGNLPVTALTQDVSSVYIGDHLQNDIRAILNDFDSMIGIPNSNLQKKERMIVDEANMNNFETRALCYVWKEMLDLDMKRCNKMYDLNLSVDFRKEVMSNAESLDHSADSL
jgi:hypothetical protein